MVVVDDRFPALEISSVAYTNENAQFHCVWLWADMKNFLDTHEP